MLLKTHRFSVTKSWPILHNPVDCSMPLFLVPHHLLEFSDFLSALTLYDSINGNYLSSDAPE